MSGIIGFFDTHTQTHRFTLSVSRAREDIHLAYAHHAHTLQVVLQRHSTKNLKKPLLFFTCAH